MQKKLKLIFLFLGASLNLLNATTFTTAAGGETFMLDGDYFLTGHSSIFGAYSAIILDNSTGSAKSVTLDGANHTVYCSTASATQTLQKTGADNLTVTLQNCRLRNFDANFTQAGPGFVIRLGNNVEIIYETDYTLDRGETQLIVGNTTFNCNGNTLTNAAGPGYFDLSSTATLTVKNGTLKCTTGTFAGSTTLGGVLRLENLRIVNNATTLTLDWQSGSNYCNMQFAGTVVVTGKNRTTIGSNYNFNLQGGGLTMILSDAILKVERGNNLQYQAIPIIAGDTNASKRRFQMQDISAKLWLDGCTITSTTTGLAFDRGNLIIDGKVNFAISTNAAAQAQLGSSLVVDILPSATLKLNGPTEYILTAP